MSFIPSIIEKLVDSFKIQDADPLYAQIFLCLRVLLVRVSPEYMQTVWPLVLMEIFRTFEDSLDSALLLSACKFIDLALVLQPQNFLLYQWCFVSQESDNSKIITNEMKSPTTNNYDDSDGDIDYNIRTAQSSPYSRCSGYKIKVESETEIEYTQISDMDTLSDNKLKSQISLSRKIESVKSRGKLMETFSEARSSSLTDRINTKNSITISPQSVPVAINSLDKRRNSTPSVHSRKRFSLSSNIFRPHLFVLSERLRTHFKIDENKTDIGIGSGLSKDGLRQPILLMRHLPENDHTILIRFHKLLSKLADEHPLSHIFPDIKFIEKLLLSDFIEGTFQNPFYD